MLSELRSSSSEAYSWTPSVGTRSPSSCARPMFIERVPGAEIVCRVFRRRIEPLRVVAPKVDIHELNVDEHG
jgi:hypothetical protein